jgi:hypothetical protein
MRCSILDFGNSHIRSSQGWFAAPQHTRTGQQRGARLSTAGIDTYRSSANRGSHVIILHHKQGNEGEPTATER